MNQINEFTKSNCGCPIDLVFSAVLDYAVKYSVSIEDALGDMEFAVEANLRSMIIEAGEYVLGTLNPGAERETK